MIDLCDTVGAGTSVGLSSSCTGDSGVVAMGFRKMKSVRGDIRARLDFACPGWRSEWRVG
jgi:hypothetical protein